MAKRTKEWREFEIAVASFMQSLDKNSKVSHDVRTPDAQTGASRQRDVIIESTICQIIPIRILISCKRYKRKLNEMDIDHFYGEFVNSNANKGILYSYSGFNGKAVEKAEKLKISCMTIVNEEKSNVPISISFEPFYFCCPHFFIRLIEKKDPNGKYKLWREFLTDKIENENNDTMLDLINEKLIYHQNEVKKKQTIYSFPEPWIESCELSEDEDKEFNIKLEFGEYWEVFKYKGDVKLVSGVFSFTEKVLMSTITVPLADSFFEDPGPNWQKVEAIPPKTKDMIVYAPMLKDLRSYILKKIGDNIMGKSSV